jgi:hypothetical protein
MKIFHIPPKYLDTTHLNFEKDLLEKLFFKITDGEYSASELSQDRLLIKFHSHHQYIFIRLSLIIDELRDRGLDVEFDETKFLSELQHSQEYEFDEDILSSEIDMIYSVWQEYLSVDPSIPALIEQLSLTNPEQLFQEMEFLIERCKKDYEFLE